MKSQSQKLADLISAAEQGEMSFASLGDWYREGGKELIEDGELFRTRKIMGWLRGHSFIGLPEHVQTDDLPLFTFD